MNAEPRRMRFGVFLGPYHRFGVNPNLAMQRDLELASHLERLGFDEIWYGEHHSGGVETIASPELMIAAASQCTERIRLGTGVSSLPYHQPFVLADRIIQLDHMTRGRMMFGVGPGQLLDDARMIGIEPSTNGPEWRRRLMSFCVSSPAKRSPRKPSGSHCRMRCFSCRGTRTSRSL